VNAGLLPRGKALQLHLELGFVLGCASQSQPARYTAVGHQGSVSATIKSFITESGDPTDPIIEREIEKVSKDVVAQVALSGHRIVKHQIAREGTYYRAYVLIEMPARQTKQAIVKRGDNSDVLKSRLRASKAFQELEAESGKVR
jgi:hypothetical protein